MEQFLLELVRSSSSSVVVLILGRWIFNDVIKRMEALEKGNTQLVEAISDCKLNNAIHLVAKPECDKNQEEIKKWVSKVEGKVDRKM